MEILTLLVVVGLIYFYVTHNSRKIKDETIIRSTQTVKTENGEQTITRVTKINETQTDIRKPTDQMLFPDHKIVNPSYQQHQNNTTIKPSIQHSEPTQPQNVKALPQLQFKKCSGCERTQPTTEFRANPKSDDGLTKWCKSCLQNGAPNPTDMKGTKVCEKCQQNRLKTSFYPTKKYPDGLSKWCKFCLPKRK